MTGKPASINLFIGNLIRRINPAWLAGRPNQRVLASGDGGEQGQGLCQTPQFVVDPGSSPARSRYPGGCDRNAGLAEHGGGTWIYDRSFS